MWSWDQGRLDYFQFDQLRKLARFAVSNDLKSVSTSKIRAAVGLPFLPNDPSYKPWRNYSRVFKLALLATDDGSKSAPTKIATLLSVDGQVTADEYFHFLASATTDPSPALQGWNNKVAPRYPLLFALKFILARASVGDTSTPISQIVSAYAETGFVGDEDETAFLGIISPKRKALTGVRQANESLRVLSQISYLNSTGSDISVSLAAEDSIELFLELGPVSGKRQPNGGDEIQRIASLFDSAIADLDLDYDHTVLSDVIESGFPEGGKAEKTHITIERNSKLRDAFFEAYPSPICDFCGTDTSKIYPWSARVLDVHHVLPLCSGTRTTGSGTNLADLVANCPTCHRAVHRFYGQWLKKNGKKDFADAAEARSVYDEAKKVHLAT